MEKKDKEQIPSIKQLDLVLEQKLEQIQPEEGAAPEALKEEVFSTLDTVTFIAELADFFTVKFTEVEMSVFEAASEMIREEEE